MEYCAKLLCPLRARELYVQKRTVYMYKIPYLNMSIPVFSYILIFRPRKSFSISCRQTQTFDHTSLFRSLQFNEPILCTATFTFSRYGDDFCISPHVHCLFCQNFYQSAVHVLLFKFYPYFHLDFILILS